MPVVAGAVHTDVHPKPTGVSQLPPPRSGPRGPALPRPARRRSRFRNLQMKYRKLGDSDLTVSEISLGSWLTYGVGVERDKAAACVDRAFELGINFIDTANAYGGGAAEF